MRSCRSWCRWCWGCSSWPSSWAGRRRSARSSRGCRSSSSFHCWSHWKTVLSSSSAGSRGVNCSRKTYHHNCTKTHQNCRLSVGIGCSQVRIAVRWKCSSPPGNPLRTELCWYSKQNFLGICRKPLIPVPMQQKRANNWPGRASHSSKSRIRTRNRSYLRYCRRRGWYYSSTSRQNLMATKCSLCRNGSRHFHQAPLNCRYSRSWLHSSHLNTSLHSKQSRCRNYSWNHQRYFKENWRPPYS